MRLRGLTYRVEYVLYRVCKALILSLSHARVRRLGGAVGRMVFSVFPPRRRLTLANLERVYPQLDPKRRSELARRSFEHIGAAFFEFLSASRFTPEEMDGLLELEGWHHIEALQQRGSGFLLFTGHYGSFEIAALPVSARLGSLHVVARPMNNPGVNRDVEATRHDRFGISWIDKRRAGVRMLNVLRSGGVVGVVIDQRVRPGDGILVPFLGHQAWTSPLAAYLSIVTGLPAVPVFCVPLETGRYRLSVEPPIYPEGKGPAAETALTCRYLETVEAQIRRRPELWMWMHTRWQLRYRAAPEGFLEFAERDSKLPIALDRSSFDLSRLSGALQRQLRDLESADFVEEASNVLLVGGAGTGKTHAACALGRTLLRGGLRVLYGPVRERLQGLLAVEDAGQLEAEWRRLDKYDLVILDGIGEEPLSAAEAAMLERLVGQRHRRRPILVTSRLPPGDWPAVLGDSTGFEVAVAQLVEPARRLDFGPPSPVEKEIAAAQPQYS